MPRPQDPHIHTERQQQILQASRIVFARQGLADTRMEDIASESGLSKGTLYLYYKNKDDLIAALLNALLEEMLVQLRVLLNDDNLTIEARLLDYSNAVVRYMEGDPSILNIAYGFYAVAAYQPAMYQALKKYFREYRHILEDLFNKGVAREEYGNIDTAQAAITFIAFLEGITLLWFTDPDHIELKSMLPRMIQQFFAGLKLGRH